MDSYIFIIIIYVKPDDLICFMTPLQETVSVYVGKLMKEEKL